MPADDKPNLDSRPRAEPARKRRASLLEPAPAALMGLGLLSGAPVAQAQSTFARDDYFRVLPDTVTALPVMDNDTVPDASSTVGLWVPPSCGNVIPGGTFFDFVPPPGALATLRVEPPPAPAPVPALGAAGLAGMLGLRRSRRS